jgi:hypothetical protein
MVLANSINEQRLLVRCVLGVCVCVCVCAMHVYSLADGIDINFRISSMLCGSFVARYQEQLSQRSLMWGTIEAGHWETELELRT